ncbi:hypothetical protein QQM79_19765 [Marinobacteraceae bacterium S3BR75-40.1]
MAAGSDGDPKRGQRQAALIFLIGFVPVVLATVMYFAGWGIPESRSNKGVLLDPIPGVAHLGLQTAEGRPFTDLFVPAREDATWQLLLLAPDCRAADCETALYNMRQVNRALGRDVHRVERAAWLAGDHDLLGQYPGARAVKPGPEGLPEDVPGLEGAGYQIYVIDPLGNMVLRYGPEHGGDAMLDDLEHLLKLSNIG